MRLHEIESAPFQSYGESGSMKGLDPGYNVFASQAVRKTTGRNVDKSGMADETDAASQVDMQTLQDAAKRLEEQLAEQGVQLKFEVVRSSKGEIEVEVMDEHSSKVLMRIPPKGVLRINAEGKTAIGSFLNLHS